MPRKYAVKRLTERDHAVLQWIGRSGIASEQQLIRRFWPGRRASTARDRLRQIAKAGYLTPEVCDVRRPGEQVYTLTSKGRLVFDPVERSRLQVGRPAAGEIRQQLIAQDTFLHLEDQAHNQGGRLVDWRAERELRGDFRRAQHDATTHGQAPPTWEIADAQVVIESADGRQQALDIEIDGQYYGKMLRQKAARFGESDRPTLWVCTAQRRAGAVQRVTAPYSNIQVVVV